MGETFIYRTIENCVIKGDFYKTSEINAPLIVYIHGGGLIWGSRKDILKKHVELYNNAGFNVFSIDYRLAPETKLPHIISDINEAITAVKKKQTYDFNRNKIIVTGSSAGGYLALCSGLFETKPQAIVSFYGYGSIIEDWYLEPSHYYLEKTHVPELLTKQLIKEETISSAPLEKRFAIYLYCRQQGKWLDYISDAKSENNYEQLKKYCPLDNLNETYPPTLLLHGNRDKDVPYNESVKFAAALNELGVANKLITIKNGGHDFDRHLSDEQTEELVNDIVNFLKKYV